MNQAITNNNVLSEVSLFREKMSKHNFIFSYRGKMSHAIVKNLLSLTEKKIDALQEDGSIKKKIFGVMINCLQTICSSEKLSESDQEKLFMINKSDSGYMIFNGVYLSSSHSKAMGESLDRINQLSNESLSDLRKEKLMEISGLEKTFSIDEATLGFINIAKRTGQRINYSIEPVENDKCFFSLQIHIN